nr:thioredoxin domain-containing protein [candidate division Zixibacteria bacterium]NIT61267.1 thioredoxin domain-containing protein [Fodinibius sp.]NIS48685.1 thioredoxin domain-containing protein [candidate division Zixibacteria bacterium]NIU16756.1 thioredoxin domain-containing protein [candidate division Zixibacteria bacterium]NIV08917.1 thioredoxin domain-containing protein [candidate division Zixibacteria bacterium]
WPFHDRLFATELQSETSFFDSLAQTVDLNLSQFKADFFDETTRSKVAADIELAIRLNVNATPTLFLNQRLLSENHPQAIRILIDHILRRFE